jgi:DNA polymerase-3 subunit delta
MDCWSVLNLKAGVQRKNLPIIDAIKSLPPFTELVLLDGKIKSTNPLLHSLAGVGKVTTFPRLKGAQINQWVEKRVKSLKSSISPIAVELLVRLVGNDLWMMANEIDKLVLYTGDRSIEEDDVKTVVSNVQEANVFAMVDAIIESRVALAQQLLQQLFKQGMAPSQVLVMLARQVRIVFQVKEMRAAGRSRGDIQSSLGLTSDFVLRKAWEQADRYSLARIREVYHKLLDADIAIKTGRYDNPDLVMDILVAEMGQRGAVSA